MSNQWISHYNENNQNPTGQMICLRHVFKIRTFRKDVDGRTSYLVVFESDVLGNNGNVTWQYNSRNDAEEVIMRIVAGVQELELSTDSTADIRKSRLFTDLVRGFDAGKPNRSR